MRDINFWIGTGIGFLSALSCAVVVAWLQYKLRIREHEYERKEQELDREKERRDREEAERKGLIDLLGDLHSDIRNRDDLQRILVRYTDRHLEDRSRDSVRSWFRGVWDRPSEFDFQNLSLFELRGLYATVVNVLSVAPLSALFDMRKQEIERATHELSELSKHIRATLPRSDTPASRKD
jgi:hypothetical protein